MEKRGESRLFVVSRTYQFAGKSLNLPPYLTPHNKKTTTLILTLLG